MGAEMSIEAMKLALDCLEDIFGKEKIDVGAINALRQAIAEAEKQEPVAWMREDEDCTDCIVWEQTEEHTIPLYTTPPRREWFGLTGSEVVKAYRSVSDKEWAIGGLDDARVFFCAIEAKLREKNGC